MRAHMGCGSSVPAHQDSYPMPTKPAPPISAPSSGGRHVRRRHTSASPHTSFDSEASFKSCEEAFLLDDELIGDDTGADEPTPAPATRINISESMSPRTPDRRPMTASRLPTRPAPPRVQPQRAEVRFITEKTDNIVSSSGGGVSTAFDSNPDKPSALRGVDLTKLRDALVREQMECTDGTVSVARLNACLHRCVNPGNRAPSTAVSALFNAVDVDDTGRVDVADVLITCAALCTSPNDPCARMKVAFDACDVDGDGSLTKDQAIKMLRGAVCSAACAFSLDGSRRFQNTETNDENADPNVRAKTRGSDTVTLTIPGGYTMSAPRLRHMMGSDANKFAMRVDESMSVDVYVDVLVDDLFARHDTDWAGAVTWSDVGEYAGTSAFLRAWFGLDARVL